MISCIGSAVLLMPCIFLDIKIRKLPVWYMAVLGAAGIIFSLFWVKKSWLSIAGGISIGLLMILLAKASREAVGYGDGLLIASVGAWYGFTQTLSAVLLALLITGISGAALMIFRKKRNFRLPFAPFLGLGCLLTRLLFWFGGGAVSS